MATGASSRGFGIGTGTARMLCRMFTLMYKLGVNDCARAEDEGLAREWIALTSEPGVFGRLGDETSHDPLYWQLTIRKELHPMGMGGQIMSYSRQSGRYGANYLSVAWALAQSFYNLGMEDWMDDPGCCGLTEFNCRQRARWGRKVKTWKQDAVVSRAQEFCFQLRRRDTTAGGKLALRERHYDMFIKAIGLASIAVEDSMR